MPGQIKCTHCGQVYGLTDEQVPQYAGKTITCTQCGKAFTVPGPAIAPPPPPPSPRTGMPPAYPSAGPVSSAPPTYPSAGPSSSAPPAYPTQYDQPTPQNVPQTTSGMAVASVVCGAMGFVIPAIPSLLGIIFGIIGLNRTKDPKVGGKGLAITGISLGAVSLVVVLPCMLAILLPSLNRARETANRVKCSAHLKSIAQAMFLYAGENRGVYPARLEDLILTQDIASAVFVCPASDDTPSAGTTAQAQAQNLSAGGHLSYIYAYAGQNVRLADLTERHVVVYEPIHNHDDDGSNVLFGDGHVEFVRRAEIERMMVQLNAGQNPPSRR